MVSRVDTEHRHIAWRAHCGNRNQLRQLCQHPSPTLNHFCDFDSTFPSLLVPPHRTNYIFSPISSIRSQPKVNMAPGMSLYSVNAILILSTVRRPLLAVLSADGLNLCIWLTTVMVFQEDGSRLYAKVSQPLAHVQIVTATNEAHMPLSLLVLRLPTPSFCARTQQLYMIASSFFFPIRPLTRFGCQPQRRTRTRT